MIIFGKDERVKFEAIRDTLSNAVCGKYDEAQTYHDGKWVMFEPIDTFEFDDYMKAELLRIANSRERQMIQTGQISPKSTQYVKPLSIHGERD